MPKTVWWRRATIALAVAATASLTGCARTPTPTAVVASMTTATTLFCAYGGVGLVPDPLPPGYETEFAAIVVELDNPGAAVDGVSVLGATLLDGAGTPSASLRRVDHVVVLPTAPSDPTWGIFAVYLNPEGAPSTARFRRGALACAYASRSIVIRPRCPRAAASNSAASGETRW